MIPYVGQGEKGCQGTSLTRFDKTATAGMIKVGEANLRYYRNYAGSI